MIANPDARSYVLAFADDEHAIGSRHANWIGLGPFLEEDLAFCSIAQDELGHALALYELLMPVNEIDRFALLRDPDAYRSCALAEWECAQWPEALVRHWVYDAAEELRWSALRNSSIPELAQLAAQVTREEEFHRTHAEMMMSRVCTDRSAVGSYLQPALDALMVIAESVWVPPAGEEKALEAGIADRTFADMHTEWFATIAQQASDWGLTLALSGLGGGASRETRSPGFDVFLESLGAVLSLDLDATW